MANGNEGILELLIKLGVVGESDVRAAKGLLDEYKESASKLEEEMGVHTVTQKEVGEAIEGTGKIAQKASEHFSEMHSMMRGLNQIVPGLGYLFRAAFSPVTGIVLAFGFAFAAAKHVLAEWNEEMDAAAERASKPLDGGVQALKTGWDESTASLGKYLAELSSASSDKDPISTMIARQKALDDAKIEGIKKVIEATGKLEEATIRANEAGQDPAKIEADMQAAQARTQARLEEIEGKKTVADLEKEQAARQLAAATLARNSAAAVEPARAADLKATQAAETLKNLREANDPNSKSGGSAVGLTTIGDLKKLETLKYYLEGGDKLTPEAVATVDAAQAAHKYFGEKGTLYEATNEKIEAGRLAIQHQQALQRQLEAKETADAEAKAKADLALENARAAETKNAARLGELPVEISQAKALAGIQAGTAADVAAAAKKQQAIDNINKRTAGMTTEGVETAKEGMIDSGAKAQDDMVKLMRESGYYSKSKKGESFADFMEEQEKTAMEHKAVGRETQTDMDVEGRYGRYKADTETIRIMAEVLKTYQDQGASMIAIMQYHQSNQTSTEAVIKQLLAQAKLNAASIAALQSGGTR